MNIEVFLKSTELNNTSIMSGTDASELFQSSSIAWRLLTQGAALGWNLQTLSALVGELYRYPYGRATVPKTLPVA